MRSLNKIACLLAFVLAISSVAGAIPWPIGTIGPDSVDSYSLMNTYGEMNNPWIDVGSGVDINFHTGIDISYEDIVTENVWCIENGVFTHCYAFMDQAQMIWEYIAVVCPSSSSDEGWCYCHVEGNDGNPIHLDTISAGDPVGLGDLLGTMTERTDKHLHFARTAPTAPFGYPGIDNPLDHLEPAASVAEGFQWILSSPNKSTFFLRDYPAFGDPGDDNWETLWPTSASIYPDTIDRTELDGAVDLFFDIVSYANGEVGFPHNPTMPQKLKWTLNSYDPVTSSWIGIFTKYVVDFDEELGNSGSSPSDWQEYKRLYFKYLGHDIAGGGTWSYVTCLTNCGDATGWDGINNIEENCWQTDSDNQFSGVTTNPVLAAYPDGPYQVNILSYPYDTTVVFPESIYVELHNFSPVVEKVVISCGGRTIWEAYWTADGLTPKWNNPSDQGVLPDQQLDVTVVFSEPMDTTSVSVTAGVSSPYNDITASDAGLDWSWTNCPEEPEYKDTWHGVFDDLTGCASGRMTISIQAEDHDSNDLTDPSVSIYDGRYNDTHHSFSVMGVQPGWPVTLHDYVKGSPVLVDLDADGDLDVALQSTDGWVHLLDDSGNTLNSHWPMQSGGWGSINVYACPSIVDLDGDGDLDVLSV
ncbi:MAG: hypothetical protein GQ565_10075, partial [Candidatus Aegiribacteria sp.]|nr:hypothetical protein [Candidatus Aegiribacteria sp.]